MSQSIPNIAFNELAAEIKVVLEHVAENIPNHLYGVDRIAHSKKEIDKISREFRMKIREYFEAILREMLRLEASDLDFGGHGSKHRFWMRIHGNKKPIDHIPDFNYNETNLLILNILTEKQVNYLLDNRNLDFSYLIYADPNSPKMNRFRCDCYFDFDNLALNARAILGSIRPFDSLGFHPAVAKIFNVNFVKEGLILVTGITGSGKSATLDSIIELNNTTSHSHIVIIAAPLEYVHESKKCIIRHREVGRDVLSFKDGTIQALRQDPDIIMIGELRDQETIIAALDVTDSGHKVFSTLHTSSAVETIDRIIGETEVNEQERVRNRLADVIKCVVSQKLVPTVDGKRILAKEVLVVTPSVRAAIKNNNTGEIYQMIHQSGEIGMNTMEQDLKRLYLQKKITYDTAMSFANQKNRMQQLLTGVK